MHTLTDVYHVNFHVCVFRYNLLHHVAGEIEGVKGAWAYPEGGMGAVSAAICSSALERGAHVFTEQVRRGVHVTKRSIPTGGSRLAFWGGPTHAGAKPRVPPNPVFSSDLGHLFFATALTR